MGEVFARYAFFAFAVFGVCPPGADVGVGQVGDRAGAVFQVLVDVRFCLVARGDKAVFTPAGAGVGKADGADQGGEQGFFEHESVSCG